MSFHLINNNQGQSAVIATAHNVSYPAGSGPGASVSTSVKFVDRYKTGRLPASLDWVVAVELTQPALVTISGKSDSGFTVTLTPVSGTLAAGKFNVSVVG